MIQFSFEHILQYELGSTNKCQRKLYHKFPGITVPSTTDIHKLTMLGLMGHFWTRNFLKNAICLRLEHVILVSQYFFQYFKL